VASLPAAARGVLFFFALSSPTSMVIAPSKSSSALFPTMDAVYCSVLNKLRIEFPNLLKCSRKSYSSCTLLSTGGAAPFLLPVFAPATSAADCRNAISSSKEP